MELHCFTVGSFAENTYLLINEKEALLIDPGFQQDQEFNTFQEKLLKTETTLKAVLLTHAHVDHILGLHRVLDNYDIPVYLNDSDRFLWNNFASQAQMFGFKATAFSFNPKNLPAQSSWSIYSFSFDIRYTPGHAPDHVSLYNSADQFLIAGDTLFKEGIGRTDLYKGSMEQLGKSIRKELFTLPDETTVYPGHGPATTIGYEKSHNPFL